MINFYTYDTTKCKKKSMTLNTTYTGGNLL